MPAMRPLALVISTSLAAGCAVGPDYHRPDAPLADHYLGQAAVEQRAAVSYTHLTLPTKA